MLQYLCSGCIILSNTNNKERNFMSKTFLTADLHLGHENIIKYENRPFPDKEAMDAAIIKNWNNVVSNFRH